MLKEGINTELRVIKDSYSSDAQSLFSSYAMNKHNLVFESLKIKYKDLHKLIADIEKTYPGTENNYFPISIFYDFYVLEHEKFLITLDSYDNKKAVLINFYFNSYTESQHIFKMIKQYEDKDDDLYVSITSYYMDQSKNIKNSESIKVLDDFNLNLDYYPYLDTNEMFKQYLMSDGNLLILCGAPGVGKSKLGDLYMKYLLEHIDTEDIRITEISDTNSPGSNDDFPEGVQVAYIKNEEILARDEIWNDFKDNEFNLVFLDDLDYGLLPRTQNIASGVELHK
jgi:ABC-type multidrug transport system fused ATPase/permease subunit